MSTNYPGAVLAAEWTKIRSLRSTTGTLAGTIAVGVGLAAIGGWSTRAALAHHSAMIAPGWNPIQDGLVAVLYAQYALIAFGALIFTTEYSSGTIALSLAAVPSRRLLFAAKTAAAVGAALAVSVVTSLGAFLADEAALGRYGVSLGAPGALRAVLGSMLYLTLICALSAGVAAILRSSALALGVLLVFFGVASPLLAHIGATKAIAQYLPDQAGSQIMKIGLPHSSMLGAASSIGPWAGLGWPSWPPGPSPRSPAATSPCRPATHEQTRPTEPRWCRRRDPP